MKSKTNGKLEEHISASHMPSYCVKGPGQALGASFGDLLYVLFF